MFGAREKDGFAEKRFIHHGDTKDTDNFMAVHRENLLQTSLFSSPCTLRLRSGVFFGRAKDDVDREPMITLARFWRVSKIQDYIIDFTQRRKEGEKQKTWCFGDLA